MSFQLMQASLCLYCHQKGQSCLPLWWWLRFPVCYLHCNNAYVAIWQSKPGIWSGGKPIMPLQKITSIQLDQVPELADPAELLQAQEGRGDTEAGAAHWDASRSEPCFCMQLHHCSDSLLLELPCDSSESVPLMIAPDNDMWFLRKMSIVVTLR